MKKILSFVVAFALLLSSATAVLCLYGCTSETTDDDKISIVATVFPGYDFARAVVGDLGNVRMLLPVGSESHSYEPTAKDIIAIRNCDLFIYVGGESDTWIEDMLSSFDEQIKTLKMMDCVEAVIEESVEGMEVDDDGEEEEYDEHVWTSPKNAILITNAIVAAVSEVDPANAAVYSANAASYTGEMRELDEEFTRLFEGLANKTIIFGDRFPFRYFADEYGISYYAAFPGCSSETEPSAATVAFLEDKVRALDATTVFYIELSTHRIADTIATDTGASVALLHSCHNVTASDFASGVTYISLMRSNLETLKGALK